MILDVGCGRRKHVGSIGIDYNRDSDADVIADAEHLPFKDAAFSKVVSVVVLEHLPNPLNCLKEQYRVLKENGKIELVTDNALYVGTVLDFRGQRHDDYRDHYMIFYPKNIVRLMHLAGFKSPQVSFVSKSKFIILVELLIKLRILRNECRYKRFKVKAVKM